MDPKTAGDHEQVWLAREVMRLLVKMVKTSKLYDARHAHVLAARDELLSRMRSYLKLHTTLRLELAKDTFLLGQERLYDESSREANLAFRLYVGGVREIAIHERATDAELDALFTVLASRSEEKDVHTQLFEAGFSGIEYVCLDELAEGWEAPENLSRESLAKIAEMNRHAEAVIEQLAQRHALMAGTFEHELSDSGVELETLDEVPEAGADDDDEEADADELFKVPEQAVEALRDEARATGVDDLLLRVVDIVLDGLSLDGEAIGEANARWFLEEAPRLALRRRNMKLLATLLQRYERELDVGDSRTGTSIAKVFEELSSTESLETITSLALAGASGGPGALCQVLARMGPPGIDAAVAAYLRTSASELREALKKFIGDAIDRNPEAVRPLIESGVTWAETARWALFLVSKRVHGPAADSLIDAGTKHPDKKVSEYASFLWRTSTSKGRLKAFLDALDSEDVAERVRAAEQLAKAKDPDTLAPLKKLIADSSFVGRTIEEKRAFLAAVAAIAGSGARKFIEEQSSRKTGIFRVQAGQELREEAQKVLRYLDGEAGGGGAGKKP
jgi:hypothetical protein